VPSMTPSVFATGTVSKSSSIGPSQFQTYQPPSSSGRSAVFSSSAGGNTQTWSPNTKSTSYAGGNTQTWSPVTNNQAAPPPPGNQPHVICVNQPAPPAEKSNGCFCIVLATVVLLFLCLCGGACVILSKDEPITKDESSESSDDSSSAARPTPGPAIVIPDPNPPPGPVIIPIKIPTIRPARRRPAPTPEYRPMPSPAPQRRKPRPGPRMDVEQMQFELKQQEKIARDNDTRPWYKKMFSPISGNQSNGDLQDYSNRNNRIAAGSNGYWNKEQGLYNPLLKDRQCAGAVGKMQGLKEQIAFAKRIGETKADRQTPYGWKQEDYIKHKMKHPDPPKKKGWFS